MTETMNESDLLLLIIQNLVDKPNEARVDRTNDDRGVLLTVHVNQEDMGKIIGKEGATAQAIRIIMRGKARRSNAIVSIKIAEPAGSDR